MYERCCRAGWSMRLRRDAPMQRPEACTLHECGMADARMAFCSIVSRDKDREGRGVRTARASLSADTVVGPGRFRPPGRFGRAVMVPDR